MTQPARSCRVCPSAIADEVGIQPEVRLATASANTSPLVWRAVSLEMRWGCRETRTVMQQMPAGAMLSVRLMEADVPPYLNHVST